MTGTPSESLWFRASIGVENLNYHGLIEISGAVDMVNCLSDGDKIGNMGVISDVRSNHRYARCMIVVSTTAPYSLESMETRARD